MASDQHRTAASAAEAVTLRTIGHGRLPAERFVALLTAAGVTLLVDVRRTPASGRNPQFAKRRLEADLGAAGIGYAWVEALGGRREPQPGSVNAAVGDAALRGYADHLAGVTARDAVGWLVARAGAVPLAVMCAERDWRRCHRRLLADLLVVGHGFAVSHLDHEGGAAPHLPDLAARRRSAGVVVWDRGADRSLPGVR